MEQLEVLIKQQRTLSGYIARLWTNMQKLGQAKIDIHEVKSRLARLDDYWQRFQDRHFELIADDDLESTDYYKEDVFTFTEESYFSIRAKFLSSMTELQAPEHKDVAPDASVSPYLKQLQLPKLDLPKFSGDQLAWEDFRDLFSSLVYDVPDIPEVQKLQHLRSCLSGEAATVVAKAPLTDAAYRGAWSDLVARYDNQRILLFGHMRNLLSSPNVSKASPTEFKRLLGVVTQSVRAFTSLKRPVEQWDDWLVLLLVSKLDSHTRLQWETSLGDSRAFPPFSQLKSWLENRIRAMEVANPNSSQSQSAPAPASNQKGAKSSRVSANAASTAPAAKTKSGKCPLCRDSHVLAYCAKYKAMTVKQRGDLARKLGACLNCLRSGHRADACTTTGRCLVCAGRHHTSLHGFTLQTAPTQGPAEGREATSAPDCKDLNPDVSVLTSAASSTVLLTTAQIILRNGSRNSIKVRALLDSGSQVTFVTEWVAQQLRAKRKRVNVTVAGLQGTQTGTVNSTCLLTVSSPIRPSMRMATEALVFRNLTNLLPARRVVSPPWAHLDGLELADPTFGVPAKVDAILGADLYGQILEAEIRRGPPGSPTAQLTAFGWVLTGTLNDRDSVSSHRVSVHHAQPSDELTTAIQRFWELEEVTSQSPQTPDEVWAEQHFRETHARDHTGRYIVRLPRKKEGNARLGASRRAALHMLLNSERRLDTKPDLRKRYADFLVEYLALGHMDPVDPGAPIPWESFYLPHHAVVKSGDPSGRICVVFNASFRTALGHSLNDVLLPGPRLQSDLWTILTRWRLLRIGFMADIVKMFRQIRIHHEDADLQRILWRADPSEEVRNFRLTTVTYGTASAPFLALRTLRQLAQDESARFPLGAGALLRHSYVDDILAGGDSPEEAGRVQGQLVSLLRAGGFELSKWASNWRELCPRLDQESRLLPAREAVGALGIIWNPQSDTLALRVSPPCERPNSEILTKRMALSEVAKLFDPLGWVLIFAKIFIQDLWLTGRSWDDPLPNELFLSWQRFRASLHQLDEVRLPRWIQTGSETSNFELHGFSDASERAYAAAAYLRVEQRSGDTSAHLLMARTKVAPVKTQSIPRLELCGAVLLARLLSRIATDLNIPVSSIHAWTDAQVVLNWLRSHASRWTPFVAGRVAEIQDLLPPDQWNYVQTAHNPADAATRGVLPKDLLASDLWWQGPSWLRRSRDSWPGMRAPVSTAFLEEERRAAVHTVQIPPEEGFVEKFSSFTRLVRVTAYCFRFPYNALKRGPTRNGFLTADELQSSRSTLIRLVQEQAFQGELAALRAERPIPAKSPLRGLQPLLDQVGLLRVGGRIQATSLPYHEKYPLLLPKSGHFTTLVIRQAHLATFHGGPQLTRGYLLRHFWILGAASRVRWVVRQCVRCTRFRAETCQQRMSPLPPERVLPARPFISSGVDYAGPLRLRTSKGRGHTSTKGYICLFVCLVTRAIHLEAVSDRSASSFIAAFRRFIGRRGRCNLLLSDNGTNFRGADAELRAMFRAASEFYREVGACLANDGTTWRFIPPHAPHFGGLWEAGVRSTKHHLRRLLKDHTLTYEELATLLCQIETCLNSRPLGPLSSDPGDLVALTPGHFLVGEPTVNLPEPAPSETSSNLLNRWRLISVLRNHFWQRWAREYLHQLQQTPKWYTQRANLKIGDLVLIKDELLPPAKWPLGRITEVNPGPDGLVRVATSTLTRPITRLCLLPVEDGLLNSAGSEAGDHQH